MDTELGQTLTQPVRVELGLTQHLQYLQECSCALASFCYYMFTSQHPVYYRVGIEGELGGPAGYGHSSLLFINLINFSVTRELWQTTNGRDHHVGLWSSSSSCPVLPNQASCSPGCPGGKISSLGGVQLGHGSLSASKYSSLLLVVV